VYTYQVMVVNSDGSGLHAVASSTMFGVNLAGEFHSTAWTADGKRVSFSVQGDPNQVPRQAGVWTVGNDGGGLTRTIASDYPFSRAGLSWSPVGRKLVYPCSFRTDGGNSITDLCILDEIKGETRQLPIDWPGRLGLDGLKWMPDGERILFTANYDTAEDQN